MYGREAGTVGGLASQALAANKMLDRMGRASAGKVAWVVMVNCPPSIILEARTVVLVAERWR